MTTLDNTYLIKNSTVFLNDFHARAKRDILVQNGKILAIEEEIKGCKDYNMICADNLFLTTGWIDSHVHVYQQEETIGVSADSMLRSGVTFALDAGTTGAYNFTRLYEEVMRTSEVQVKAYLHIGKWGISSSYGELLDMNNIDQQACVETCAQYSDEILGLKARIDPRVCADEERTLQLLRFLGDKTGKRIVVHGSRSRLPLELILSYFKKGDIFAHSYADKSPGIMDANGCIKEAAQKAKNRGVIFDLSHGNGNFSFEVARKAIRQDFIVDTISTDLHSKSKERVGDMAAIMTKILHLGLSLEDVLRRVLTYPIRMLELESQHSELLVGQEANITGFRLDTGTYDLCDCEGAIETASQKISNVFTILGNHMVFAEQDN